MVQTSICLIALALVLSLGPGVEVKAKRCKKPSGLPGDYAKCSMKGKWVREYPLQKIQETVDENGEKLDELLKTAAAECPMVVFGDYYNPDNNFQTTFIPYHVVTNEEDFLFGEFREESSNYWLTPDGATGDDAQLFMVFQCPRTIKGFLVKNTRNLNKDRGTKDFTISISDSIDGPWTDILTGTLPDARNVSPVPVLNFDLENEVETQYLRFQVDTFYGQGGGLQYFSTY